MRVHILATCRRPDLLPYTLLVFKTLRTGFPTAAITVYLNSMNPMGTHSQTIVGEANKVGAQTMMVDTIHHCWIEGLLNTQEEPFWILDTDVIFFDNIEQFTFTEAMAGWRIPEFKDEFSGAITRARLHTSLLYLDPKKIEAALLEYCKPLYLSSFTPQVNLVYPVVYPFKGKSYFCDTCSMLYHAIGGEAFNDAQKDAFFHFNFGTISDLVMPRLRNHDEMQVARQTVLNDPKLAKGLWRVQEMYYANRQP